MANWRVNGKQEDGKDDCDMELDIRGEIEEFRNCSAEKSKNDIIFEIFNNETKHACSNVNFLPTHTANSESKTFSKPGISSNYINTCSLCAQSIITSSSRIKTRESAHRNAREESFGQSLPAYKLRTWSLHSFVCYLVLF